MHIIVALAAGEQHGYDIMRAIDGLSAGSVKMGRGTRRARSVDGRITGHRGVRRSNKPTVIFASNQRRADNSTSRSYDYGFASAMNGRSR
jgi:hypothetical protein